jgi:TonB family protein
MKADSSALANDPFAGLARQIENLAVNSVQLRPGAGLYVLAAALSLAAVLVISRVLSVSTATEATLEPYPDQSNGRARSFAFFALFLVALTVAVIVLVHKPGTGASTHDAAQPSPSGSQESDIFRWPTDGLPADIVNALSTTDLAPTAPADGTKELILGVAGQKQFIPAVNDDDCMGSGGCVWKIKDAATQRELLADSQGALHKTQKLTNGYYDLLVEDKWGLYLYEYQGEKYKNTLCYGRSNGLGSPARLTSCPAGVEPATTSNEVVPTPNQSVATENASGAPPIGVTKGQTSEEVLAILGPPISVTVGAKRVYSYPHSTVVFVDGKVSEVHQSSDNSGPGLGTTDVQKGIALPDSLTTPGSGGNVGGELYHVGGGVSAPVPLNTVEAGFSDEARRAKYQGVCLVSVIVDEQGNPKNPRVIRGLRMGLDEKALEAVRKYKFKPAMKDGRVPVPVMITVEVNFRLY